LTCPLSHNVNPRDGAQDIKKQATEMIAQGLSKGQRKRQRKQEAKQGAERSKEEKETSRWGPELPTPKAVALWLLLWLLV
jgi:hypothetical protein